MHKCYIIGIVRKTWLDNKPCSHILLSYKTWPPFLSFIYWQSHDSCSEWFKDLSIFLFSQSKFWTSTVFVILKRVPILFLKKLSSVRITEKYRCENEISWYEKLILHVCRSHSWFGSDEPGIKDSLSSHFTSKVSFVHEVVAIRRLHRHESSWNLRM
jgi:hypothetical protein